MLTYSSAASEPPAPGGIVTLMSSSRSATGCAPHPARNVGPASSGASKTTPAGSACGTPRNRGRRARGPPRPRLPYTTPTRAAPTQPPVRLSAPLRRPALPTSIPARCRPISRLCISAPSAIIQRHRTPDTDHSQRSRIFPRVGAFPAIAPVLRAQAVTAVRGENPASLARGLSPSDRGDVLQAHAETTLRHGSLSPAGGATSGTRFTIALDEFTLRPKRALCFR